MKEFDTKNQAYERRLTKLQNMSWKKFLNVQAPYRWNIRRIAKGTTLDIGCGLGRNLSHLGGNGVGIDHSEYCLAQARLKGLKVFAPDEFLRWTDKNKILFDNLLFAHVVEHMSLDEAEALLNTYGKFLKEDGRIILITPQQAGYASDPTHITYFDFDKLTELAKNSGYIKEKDYSFPFPRIFGKLFLYNESISIWKKSK